MYSMWRLSDRQRVTVTGFVIYLLLLLSPGPHPLHAGVLDADLRAQSIGFPAAGRLRHAVQIADKTPHLEVLPYQRHRSIHYATTYLAELLKRTAASLAKAHPGNVLQLGNSSRRRGGPIPFSISHQVGRDVDIAFQVTTLRGKPAKLKNLTVFGDDGRVDAAAYVELRAQAQKTRRKCCDQIVGDRIGHRLVEGPGIAERPHIQLQRLELDAARVRDVFEVQGREVRLAGLRAQAGEFRHADADRVIAPRLGIFESFQGLGGLTWHGESGR